MGQAQDAKNRKRSKEKDYHQYNQENKLAKIEVLQAPAGLFIGRWFSLFIFGDI